MKAMKTIPGHLYIYTGMYDLQSCERWENPLHNVDRYLCTIITYMDLPTAHAPFPWHIHNTAQPWYIPSSLSKCPACFINMTIIILYKDLSSINHPTLPFGCPLGILFLHIRIVVNSSMGLKSRGYWTTKKMYTIGLCDTVPEVMTSCCE